MDLPNKLQIKATYASYKPVFNECLSAIEAELKSRIKLQSMPTYKARIKSFNSYYEKIIKQKPEEAALSTGLVTLTDMMGIRIICAFLEDIENVVTQISMHFDVREIEHKGYNLSFQEFGYESVHVLVTIPQNCLPKEHHEPALPEAAVCEIQVRTILQDAWAEVEHELIYKSEFNPFDKPLRRKLAAINANLSLADTIFQEIREYQNKLQAELGIRRNTFYDQADQITDDELGITKEAASSVGMYNVSNLYEKGSIDDMVLSALHEHNIGNFSHAIQIYTDILDEKNKLPPQTLSVILKHRGMAYFAENDYEKALEDFQRSVECDSTAFRSFYYEGIIYSVLKRDNDALECFNKSLEINQFQSHPYYRRAIAYYNLGQYEESMSDLNRAVDLGLQNDDVKALKAKLLKKFDMNV